MASKFDVSATAERIGVAPGGLVSIVNRGIGEGWSQRQTIAVARDLDLHFGDQVFRTLWRHQEAAFSRMGEVLASPPDQPIDPRLVTPTTWGKPGVFYHWITIVRRDRQTGEIVEDTTVRWGDELRSADDVTEDVMADLTEGESGSIAGYAFLGASMYNVTSVGA